MPRLAAGRQWWCTHGTGASLAFEAPLDQLYVATEVNSGPITGGPACRKDALSEGRRRARITSLVSGERWRGAAAGCATWRTAEETRLG